MGLETKPKADFNLALDFSAVGTRKHKEGWLSEDGRKKTEA